MQNEILTGLPCQFGSSLLTQIPGLIEFRGGHEAQAGGKLSRRLAQRGKRRVWNVQLSSYQLRKFFTRCKVEGEEEGLDRAPYGPECPVFAVGHASLQLR